MARNDSWRSGREARRPYLVDGGPILEVEEGRDHSLDAALGVAFGVVLGTICWLQLGVVVYLIVR